MVFIDSRGSVKLLLCDGFYEETEKHGIPQEMIIDLRKLVVRLIRDKIELVKNDANEDPIHEAMSYLDGALSHYGSGNELAYQYDGSIDYCLEVRDKVRRFVEYIEKPSYKVPANDTDVTKAASPATDKLSATIESLSREVTDSKLVSEQEQEAMKSLFECFANEMRVRLASIEAYQAKERRKQSKLAHMSCALHK